jgi:hypothetical protein
MSLVLTPTVTNNFTPSANPIPSPPWSLITALDFTAVEQVAVGSNPGYCIATDAAPASGGAIYTGASFSDDQYVSMTVVQMSEEFFDLYARCDGADLNNYYDLEIGPAGPGIVNIGLLVGFSPTDETKIASVFDQPWNPGDVFTLACIGSTLYILQNGTILTQVVDTTWTSGSVGFDIFPSTNPSTDLRLSTFVAGSAALGGSTISGNAGVAGATVAWAGTSSGSTTADGSGNYTTSGLANGSYTITPSLTGYTFSPTSQNETVSGSNITGVNFTATAGPSPIGWSPTDCRNYATFPNQAVVQASGAEFFTKSVPPTCNEAGLPEDSRASVPVDSRTSIPKNSRANQ